MAKTNRYLPILIILLLGLGLRLININQSFWLDEASQANLSSLPLHQIWYGRGGDFHPPLFYFLVHTWLIFGRSEIWLRTLPLTFGIANIFIIYLLARDLFPQMESKIRYLSALLLAISPFHIYYSQELRMYSLLCLLGTMSMYFFFRRRYLLLSVFNTLLLYTHYSAIFLIATQLIYVVMYSRKELKSFTFSFLLSAFSYLPWLPQFYRQLNSGLNIDTYLPGWRQVLSISPLKAFPVIVFKLVAGRISFISRIVYGIYIVFVFTVTFLALVISPRPKRQLVIWVFFPVILLLLTSLALPQNQPFRVIYVLPGFILLFARACIRYPKLIVTLVCYIFIVGDIAYFTRPRLQRENWRDASAFLSRQQTAVVVKFSDRFAPLAWYAPDLPVVGPVSTFPAAYQPVFEKLGPALATSTRVYLLQYLTDLTDPHREVDRVIENLGFSQTKIHDFSGVGFIYEYSRQ
ncbi:MAG: Glycosyl transferase family protein [Candidatus Amesbacteria bacterium GW2011_GWB1_47_19]|nr:MAG: Glycosyl transferase family protein [Candidatus Amesbacteria bacterium GW2011_GWA1_44_24]KKU31743.1 MAG: hypothetical protein UX46_C0003G0068 [Candidatus Amesbacteria bacterium GW2011_GWC1_46_24]KKU67656.1 MAG: Glycosyl transferase family protein [Candidatus Amesbacteria bacterium GW2011_GWB1_47_19]OGD06506.1 MAG: hypothetical protein A2379_02590 [Candidatus Amesbacteria bacterium RIFOXYB1_FULL_47_13]HBC72909.1 hypothetical protein [Candidatus Amesbacteria bacterium]